MTKEEQTIILAALLRGVEAFFQPAENENAPTFVDRWRSEFARCVNDQLLQLLVRPQSDETARNGDAHTRALMRLMSCAERLASSDSSQSIGKPPTTTLAPIFDCLELTQTYAPPSRRFALKILTRTGAEEEPPIFAVEGDAPETYEVDAHIEEFKRQLEELRASVKWDSFDCVYTRFLNLLQTCAWCIPSNGQAVSLYDQLRVTSAIATCLYKFHATSDTLTDEAINKKGQTRCILLIGDVSGIQDYIFDISTTGAGGVAKRLRARSFFVQLLSDIASIRALIEFDLPLANLLMASGGNFYVLLPDLPDTVDRLRSLQKEFDRSLLKEFHGLLSINLGWTEMKDDDFAAGEYSKVLERLHGQLRRRKLQRLSGALQDEDVWHSADVFAREPFEGESICLACNRFPAKHASDKDEPENIDICDQCRRQLELGKRLTTAKYISFFKGGQGEIRCLGLSATVGSKPLEGAYLALKLNDPDLKDASSLPAMFRYMANYIPRDENNAPWSFEDIAARRKLAEGGTAKGLLGILKADVDNLGQIFQEGLRRDAPDIGSDTVSRIAALSRQMDWFFSGWLEWLLSAKYMDCYTVYSGGDDLLIVGSRARAMELGREIHEAFARYTRHPEMTISAGIAVVKPRLPLAHTVRLADSALDKAKEEGRDRLSVLGETVMWAEFASLSGEIESLSNCQSKSSFLYHLLRCAELWRLYRSEKKLLGLRYHPMLAYQIARNIDSKKEPDLHNWATRLLEIPPSGNIEQLLDHLRLIAQWVLLERRES
jgi:CRISPR-associated protein Csm1